MKPDPLVESLHAQLRALTERRQGWEHEVRTPLGVIRSNAANLRDGIDGPLTDDMRESVGSILSAVMQLEGLLDRERFTSPNIPAVGAPVRRSGGRHAQGGRARVEIVPLVRRVVGQFAARAEREGVALTFSASAELPGIWLDEVKITQVISNLLQNALEHSKGADTVHVLVTDEPAGLTLPMAALRITVRDSGRGIPPELLDRIFERGVRGRSEETAPPGRGLGLTVTRDLVGAHGGRLWAENRREGGAAFHVVLPVDLRTGGR